MNFCWEIFKWCLLAAVVGAVAAVPYFCQQVDARIHCRLLTELRQHYADLDISIRSARLIEGRGIEIRDLLIVEPDAAGPRAELIHLPEIFITCNTELAQLASGDLEVTRVAIRRPTLRLTRRPDGTWSGARLLPLPKFGTTPPEVAIEGGTVEIFDPTRNPAATQTLRNINLHMAGPGAAEGETPPGHRRRVEGTWEGDLVKQAALQGWVDPQQSTWNIRGSAEGVEITPSLVALAPSQWREKLDRQTSVQGRANVEFQLARPGPPEPAELQFSATARIIGGRVDDPRLPNPITDLAAQLTVDNGGIAVKGLSARSGPSTLHLESLRVAGWDAASPLSLEAGIEQLELNSALLNVLPASLRDQWPKYLPSGRVSAKLNASYDGQRWHQNLSVACLDVAFRFHKFPYPMQHARGNVALRDDVLTVDLHALAGNQPMSISGRIEHPQTAPLGGFTIETLKGPGLAVDEVLLRAMEEKPQAILRSLSPRGRVSVKMELWNDAPGAPTHKHLLAQVLDGAIRYERFPYPLGGIHGTLEMADDQWSFRDLVGSNDTGTVRCHGRFGDTPEGKQLLLTFNGGNIALEEELRDALGRPTIERLWRELRLQGTVDLEELTIRYCPQFPPPQRLRISLRAVPQPGTTSIEPVNFPYRLENLRGTLVYRDGHVTIDSLRAEHGEVRLVGKVTCDFQPDGNWGLRLDDLSVDQLEIDREFVRHLPERFKEAVRQWNPGGSVHLRGSLSAGRGGGPDDPVEADWNLQLVTSQGSIQFGVPLENIHGAVRLVGGFHQGRLHSRGELDIDSLTYDDVQFTRITGPIWIDDRRVLLGTSVEPPANERPRSVSGQVFGGTLYGDGWIMLGATPRYRFRTRLFQADLTQTAQEVLAGRQNLRGNVYATAEIWGEGQSLNALGGRGHVRLRDADIYELPVMIALLKLLSVREPDSSAFSEADIDFVIEGSHIYLNPIQFRGDVISLVGRGEMDFHARVDLTFGTRLGRGQLNLPLLREILGGAGDQIVVLHVEGPAHHPQVWREPLPAVNKVLQQLGEELQLTPPEEETAPRAGRLLPRQSLLPSWR